MTKSYNNNEKQSNQIPKDELQSFLHWLKDTYRPEVTKFNAWMINRAMHCLSESDVQTVFTRTWPEVFDDCTYFKKAFLEAYDSCMEFIFTSYDKTDVHYSYTGHLKKMLSVTAFHNPIRLDFIRALSVDFDDYILRTDYIDRNEFRNFEESKDYDEFVAFKRDIINCIEQIGEEIISSTISLDEDEIRRKFSKSRQT